MDELTILWWVVKHPGICTGRLRQRTGYSNSTVLRRTQRLTQAGLIERVPSNSVPLPKGSPLKQPYVHFSRPGITLRQVEQALSIQKAQNQVAASAETDDAMGLMASSLQPQLTQQAQALFHDIQSLVLDLGQFQALLQQCKLIKKKLSSIDEGVKR